MSATITKRKISKGVWRIGCIVATWHPPKTNQPDGMKRVGSYRDQNGQWCGFTLKEVKRVAFNRQTSTPLTPNPLTRNP